LYFTERKVLPLQFDMVLYVNRELLISAK